MPQKTHPLYFEIHTGSSKPCGYIRNSYRKDGKVCHDTISRINGCSLEQLKRMKDAFKGKEFTASDLKIVSGREYGASKMLYDLAIEIGLNKLIYSRSEKWVKNVLALVVGRIVHAGSKLSLSKLPIYSCLWEICTGYDEEEPVDVNLFCYDAMDELFNRQELIQQKIAKKHLKDGCVVLYDITSSYFEGGHEKSDLAEFGYNRDKKSGHKQIVIGLVCSKDGCPISVEVFKGNTNDSKTVQGKLDEINKKYGISNCILVGDRGMLTKKNLESLHETQSITALTHSNIKKLLEHENVQLSMFDENTAMEVILPEEPTIRYALKKNPVRAKKESQTRQNILAKIEELLQKVADAKKPVKDEVLGARVGKIFAKYGNEKYFKWEIKEATLIFNRNIDKILEDEKLDGLYVIRTNVTKEEMSTLEFVETYRRLINVEQAFRQLKTTQLEIRPIYHKTDDRIKSHVFLCMLSYYLLWHLTQKLKPMMEKDPVYTIDTIIETMKARQKSTVLINNEACQIIAEPNHRQSEILLHLAMA